MTDESTTTTTEDRQEDDETTTRGRTRTRKVRRTREEPAAGDGGGSEDRPEGAGADAGGADADGEADTKPVIRRRRRSRTTGERADREAFEEHKDQTGADDTEGSEPAAASGTGADRGTEDRAPRQRRRSSRRGGRGGAQSRNARTETGDAEASAADAPADPTSAEQAQGEKAEAEEAEEAEEDEVKAEKPKAEKAREPAESDGDAAADEAGDGEGEQGAQPTRLQTKARGGRGRGRGRPRRGRKPAAAVSEETRRTIAESPPRRMLVQVGEDRTQIAVLEERTLVEHYVTRKSDVSYVGNIYLGRVQNVLPGMEAAFVDIGKGRNGVLYAGEVNYDEADLDGELPRIEQTLQPGQPVLVQVTKDPMGTKGARLTQHLSVAGRYCVLAPGDGMLGISRKLPDEERERLRQLLKELKPEGFGLIVRTAADGVTREQLEADVKRLTRIWEQVQERSQTVKPLEPVYEEPNLVMRVIRDVFGTEYSHLVIDEAALAEDIRSYLREVAPDMAETVEVYEGEDRLFDAYEVTTQVRRALEKKVWLRSGGYLIIEKTEAMWVIDVNTGKFVGEDNLEETVLRNNLEAAEEIARQLRLRDMGGIIVIDFVDMLVPANRDEVLKRFKRELARDKTKSRVMDISRLGLVQMTRKNVSQGVFENFTTRCETCEGRGARILDEAFK